MTQIQNMVARAQGWALETMYDSRGYVTCAVVPSGPTPFNTPREAMEFVWGRAKEGDLTCRQALSIVSASELAGKTRGRG